MNKQQLIDGMAAKTGQTKAATKETLEAFMEVLTQALASGERVTLIGFGAFFVQEIAERTGRNPGTGKPIIIRKKKKVKFKAGAEMSGEVNK